MKDCTIPWIAFLSPFQVSSAVRDNVSLWDLKCANKLEEMTFHIVLCLSVSKEPISYTYLNIKGLE